MANHMYTPRFFKAQELVPPEIYNLRKDRSFELIDERVLMTLDNLRLTFGVCTVNDWLWNGQFSQRGLRTPDSEEYSSTSQHSFGRAIDCHFQNYEAQEVRDFIIKNREKFLYIAFLEDDVSWLHFDVRNCQQITLWSPLTKKSRIV